MTVKLRGRMLLLILLVFLTACNNITSLFQSKKKVLFIGNSYTTTANIPGLFAEIAQSAGHKVEIGVGSDRGGTFEAYSQSSALRDIMQSTKWDFVVLQEQSQIPANPLLRHSKMFPGARKLVEQIRSFGAMPIFFQTSGNRNGWPENGLANYESMQLEIIRGYAEIAQELNVSVAPVGEAWRKALSKEEQFNLWVDDRHPNEQGGYLAACILFATIFHSSPGKAKYTGSLPSDLARELQIIAADYAGQGFTK